MEPVEDVKAEPLVEEEGKESWVTPNSHNVICEPVPVEARSYSDAGGPAQPQMKWKNAFGFVYQVRKKLSNQPQLYNEFIDIMRKVHNRTIETAEVVTVISDLFKDHPDLIRGFNAFLPDKHKIDVKVRLRVAVSGIPSPDSPSGDPNEREELPITTRIIKFTLNVRKRFEDDEKRPEKYKRFVEVLYLYKALSQQLQGLRKCKKKLKEEEVYAEVRKLFENNEDLLQEFSEYLPYNKKLSDIYKDSYKYCKDDAPYNCSCCSDVSSSGQIEAVKKRPEDKRDANFLVHHDEVTSSDDPGRFRCDIAFESVDVKDVKKYDVSSTHINIKNELVDACGYNENYSIVGRDRLEETSQNQIQKKESMVTCFKREFSEEVCQDDACLEEADPNSVIAEKSVLVYDKPMTNVELSAVHVKKENFIACDLENGFFETFPVKNEKEFRTPVIQTERCRSPRKPLTPFKVPLPPSDKLQPETRQSVKRIVEDGLLSSPATKRSALCQATARSPSPPDSETETSVITRLAKRAALGTTDEEGSVEECTSPRRTTCGSPDSSPAPKSSSDRRLRNLRKRLRRLANL